MGKDYQDNQESINSISFLGKLIEYEYAPDYSLKAISHNQKEIKLINTPSNNRLKRIYPHSKEIIKYHKNQTIKSINSIEYTYNENSQVVKKENTQTKSISIYDYFENAMLKESIEDNDSFKYHYDKAGNPSNNAQRYNNLNQLIEDSNYLYKYDKRGNLKAKLHKQNKEQTIYLFNLFNQLIKWKRVDKDNQLIEGYSYSYDALNRRVSKTHITPSNTPKQTKQSTHHYLYDDEKIIAILDEHKTLLATIVHDTQTDTPLSITTYNNTPKAPSKAELYYHKNLTDEEILFLQEKREQRTYYYHRDHQGSIMYLTDEDGKVVESFKYDAYGIITKHKQSKQTLNPYGYTGREFELSIANDTGIVHDLYYYRARYYDPMQARFISQDPIEFLAGDTNFYRYVGNDPLNFVDPSGLACVPLPDIPTQPNTSPNIPKIPTSPSTPANNPSYKPGGNLWTKILGGLGRLGTGFLALLIPTPLGDKCDDNPAACLPETCALPESSSSASDGLTVTGSASDSKPESKQCKEMASKINRSQEILDKTLENYRPEEDNGGTEYTGQGGAVMYTKPCGHLHKIYQQLAGLQKNINNLEKQNCASASSHKETLTKAKAKAKAKLDEASPKCKELMKQRFPNITL